MKKENIVDSFADIGSDAVGDVVGAVVGAAVAGPAGAALGAVSGGLASKTIQTVWAEIKERFLSPKEEERIETVLSLAQSKIEENIKNGKTLRNDGFFETSKGDRSSAEETLEGILLYAQKEFEEKKIPYMANLYANLAFDDSVGRSDADRLIKIASDLTYRQLQIIGQIGRFQLAKGKIPDPRYNQQYKAVSGKRNIAIASEIYHLYRNSIIGSSEHSVILDAAQIKPSTLEVIGIGADLFNLMELSKMPLDKNTEDILIFLTNCKRAPNQK